TISVAVFIFASPCSHLLDPAGNAYVGGTRHCRRLPTCLSTQPQASAFVLNSFRSPSGNVMNQTPSWSCSGVIGAPMRYGVRQTSAQRASLLGAEPFGPAACPKAAGFRF